MISYIKGELAGVRTDTAVVENHGIGYEIRVPLTVVEELPHIGSMVKLYTYLYVREDIMQLYGFLRTEDLEVFKLLLTVSGIGPKAALGILSSITPDDLRFAILSEDKKTISKAPGIGAKTAGKLILELKDKFQLEEAFAYKFSHQQEENAKKEKEGKTETEQAAVKAMRKDAVEALTALGYSQTEAMKAVNSVDMEKMNCVEDVLKASLKAFSGS